MAADGDGCPLQFSKDLIFVGEEVADEAVGVALVLGKGGFDARAEDAVGEIVGEGGDKGLISRGKLNEPGEVGSDSIKSRNVGEWKRTKSILNNRETGLVLAFTAMGSVNCFDDLIFVGRHKRVYQIWSVRLRGVKGSTHLEVQGGIASEHWRRSESHTYQRSQSSAPFHC